jgi:hypothetical protein
LADESSTHCDCCGNLSRKIWGFVHRGDSTIAVYYLHWTDGHLNSPGANLDLILGSWGEGTTFQDRVAAALLYREAVDGPSAITVIDASERQIAASGLVKSALRRDEVIGTPLANQIFAIVDAIWIQDHRKF